MQKTASQTIAERNAEEWEMNSKRESRKRKLFKNRLVANAVLWYNFTEEQANKIFLRAWNEAHSFGYGEVENHFDSLCKFVVDVLNTNFRDDRTERTKEKM